MPKITEERKAECKEQLLKHLAPHSKILAAKAGEKSVNLYALALSVDTGGFIEKRVGTIEEPAFLVRITAYAADLCGFRFDNKNGGIMGDLDLIRYSLSWALFNSKECVLHIEKI